MNAWPQFPGRQKPESNLVFVKQEAGNARVARKTFLFDRLIKGGGERLDKFWFLFPRCCTVCTPSASNWLCLLFEHTHSTCRACFKKLVHELSRGRTETPFLYCSCHALKLVRIISILFLYVSNIAKRKLIDHIPC